MLVVNLIVLVLCCSTAPILAQVANVPSGVLSPTFTPLTPNAPLKESRCNFSAASVKIRLPFMDMEMQNHRNLHVVQAAGEQQQHLFVLHGHELFRLFVSQQEKHLLLMGYLGGSVRDTEPLDLQVLVWHDYYIIALALDGYIEIYQMPTDIVQERIAALRQPVRRSMQTLRTFDPVQQLTLFGRYQKMFLLEPEPQRAMLIVAVNFTKLHGKFRTFEWLNTYFETVEEVTVPQIDDPQIVGSYPTYLISGKSIRHQSRIVLTIYEITSGSLSLRPVQTITVKGQLRYSMAYGGHNYLVTCEKNPQKCHIFLMREGQFHAYKRRTWKELAFEKFSKRPNNVLVGLRQNEVRVFTSGRLDCFTSFTTVEKEAHAVRTYSNEFGEDFILITYKRPFSTLVRMVQVDVKGSNDSLVEDMLGATAEGANAVQRPQHLFENSIGKLKSLLLKRKMSMDVLRRVTDVFHGPNQNNLKIPNKVHIQGGTIGTIQLANAEMQSPVQLIQRVRAMRDGLRQSDRVKRSSDDRVGNFTLNLPKDLKVGSLKVRNLLYDGNVLEGISMDASKATLSVIPKVMARSVNTKELVRPPTSLAVSRQFLTDASTVTRVQKLQVHRVNGVNWDELHDLWFLRHRDTKLQGRLQLQAATKIQKLAANQLNDLVVDDLVNLRLPQQIQSNILISRFYVRDLRVQRLNGLDFANDVAFSGRDDFIETPVEFHQLKVTGDLQLADGSKISRQVVEESEEFRQYYTQKVIINGSLTVKNLLKDGKASKVLLKDQPMSVKSIRQGYLMNNENQNFSFPVHFGNAKVSTPHLQAKFLNDHPTELHLLNVEQQTVEKPILLVFMQAHIDGDLISPGYETKLKHLQRNAIKHGDVVNVTGTKYFVAPISVNNLMTLQFNELPVEGLVRKSDLKRSNIKFTSTKSFDAINVAEECHIDKEVKATYLNNMPLSKLLNYDYYYETMSVPHKLHVNNMVIHCLNGIPIEEVLSKFKTSDDVLMLHNDLIIEGNVEFSENLQVAQINGLDWPNYEQSLVHTDEDGEILSDVVFAGELSVMDSIVAPSVNDVVLEDVFPNILRKSKAQLISGEYTFGSVRMGNVDVSVVNGVPTSSFIDVRDEAIEIEGDIRLPQLTIRKDMTGTLKPDFKFSDLERRLRLLPQQQWSNLFVHGDARWNSSSSSPEYEQLEYLYKNAVLKSQEQTITGNVFVKGSPLIGKLQTNSQFPVYEDLRNIAQDALWRNSSDTQVIRGYKVFMKPLIIEKADIAGALNIKLLNGIDVLRFNESLYRLSSGNPIYGPLRFLQSPYVENMYAEGLINGQSVSYVYHTKQGVMPPVAVTDLTIDGLLQIVEINNMNLTYLLENRVPRNGEAFEVFGFLTFENLTLNKEILLQSINNIPIDNLVFEKSDHLQAITGSKVVEGNLHLDGPTHLMSLNGENLMEAHQQTLFTGGDYQIDTLIVDEATFEKGLILDTASMRRNVQERHNQISDLQEEFRNMSLRGQLKYLDYADDIFVLQQPANRSISYTFDYEMPQGSSPCSRHFIQVQSSENLYFMSNYSTNFVRASLNGLSVKVENYCQQEFRKVKSKIQISSKKLLKVFGMKKHIEYASIFSLKPKEFYVLLHGLAAGSKHNEIRLLKVNRTNDVLDMHSLSLGIGRVVRLFTHGQHITLVSKATEHNHPAVNVYAFSEAMEKFKLVQIINGDYDLFEMIESPGNRLQLVLGCRQCQRLNVYELTAAQPPYRLTQIVKVPTLIDRLEAFRMSDGQSYMLALAPKGYDYYHLYKFAATGRWTAETYGYYENLKWAVPLIRKGKRVNEDVLLLLCASVECSAVRTVW